MIACFTWDRVTIGNSHLLLQAVAVIIRARIRVGAVWGVAPAAVAAWANRAH
jgi:hypothetical protein